MVNSRQRGEILDIEGKYLTKRGMTICICVRLDKAVSFSGKSKMNE